METNFRNLDFGQVFKIGKMDCVKVSPERYRVAGSLERLPIVPSTKVFSFDIFNPGLNFRIKS